MRHFILGLGAWFVVSAVGCGNSTSSDDDDDDDGGNSAGAVPIEELPTRLAAISCKAAFSCCSAAERAENPFLGGSEAECRSNTGALLTLLVPAISASVKGGRLRYDEDAMGECMRAAEAGGCDPNFDTCAGGLIPLVPLGGACGQQAECIDSTCLGETGDMGLVDGTCTTPLPLGAACEVGDDCASGACPDFVCENPRPTGSYCFDEGDCQSGNCGSDGLCSAEPPSICN